MLATGGGLIPGTAQTVPPLTIGPAAGSNLKLAWPSLPDRTYRIWESADLASWTLVNGFPREGTGVDMEHRFVPGPGSRYYRMSSEHAAPDGFSLIPGGSFQMGDPTPDKVGDDQELPLHTVHVSAFYMGRYEVTWTLWDTVRRWGDLHGYAGLPAGTVHGTNHPVYDIDWNEMVKWCNARSEMEGLTPCYYLNGQVMRQGVDPPDFDRTANGYRLPTEAEWEKAARGGLTGFNFPWGPAISHANANFQSYGSYSYDVTPPPRGYHPDYDDGPTPHTSPVGSFPPNGYGLHDMIGNLAERCWDWHSAVFYNDPGASAADSTGPATGTSRIVRGGSWASIARGSRCSSRYYAIPGSQGMEFGFRLARNVSPIPAGFAFIPAGSFQMGDQSSPRIGIPVELPVHTVTTGAYLIAKHEVSASQWASVRAWGLTHGYTDLADGEAKALNHPVTFVTWHDAVKWCNARSEMEGLVPCYTVAGNVQRTGSSTPACNWTAGGYRLPTEAEWERAARGGRSARNFPWGDTITHRQANYQSMAEWAAFDISTTRGYHPAFGIAPFPYTAPLGNFDPNDHGVADTAGNVREWCWDWADVNYYANSPGIDPRGPDTGTQRVARGGSWSADAFQARNSSRAGFSANAHANDIGFRVARTFAAGGN